jgi:hypothetical protein
VARAVVTIFEVIAVLAAIAAGWLMISTLTQPDLMAPALAASAATAAVIAIVPYCIARLLAASLLRTKD